MEQVVKNQNINLNQEFNDEDDNSNMDNIGIKKDIPSDVCFRRFSIETDVENFNELKHN